jgi:tripartite-type tricarboxylate transporter receptor subunit TctC
VISTANTLRPLVQDGRARGIALTSATRRGSMADLPTIAESGFPGFDLTSWNGLFAPAATPAAMITRLSEAMRAAAQDPFVRERLGVGGNEAVNEPAAAFAARVAKDRQVVRQLVAETGLRLE